MGERGDVDASLAAMDDKLRKLQRELSVLTPQPESGRPPDDRADAAPEDPLGPAPQRVTVPEPEHVTARALRAAPAPDRAELPLAAAAADQARAIIADAQAEATRIVGEAAHRVAAIAAQIDDLQRLRDKLERSARALVDEYAAALPHVRRSPAARAELEQRSPARPQPPAPQRGESPVHPPLW